MTKSLTGSTPNFVSNTRRNSIEIINLLEYLLPFAPEIIRKVF